MHKQLKDIISKNIRNKIFREMIGIYKDLGKDNFKYLFGKLKNDPDVKKIFDETLSEFCEDLDNCYKTIKEKAIENDKLSDRILNKAKEYEKERNL